MAGDFENYPQAAPYCSRTQTNLVKSERQHGDETNEAKFTAFTIRCCSHHLDHALQVLRYNFSLLHEGILRDLLGRHGLDISALGNLKSHFEALSDSLDSPLTMPYQGTLGRDPDGYLVIVPISPLAVRLPPELLSEIFLYCLPDDEFIVPDFDTAPLLLCRILPQWREIALETPALWSSLHLDVNWLRKAEWVTESAAAEFFCRWISNARNTPLSFEVCEPRTQYWDEADPICGADVRTVLQHISALSLQWQNIGIKFCTYHHAAMVLPEGDTFPWLEKFAIGGPMSPQNAGRFCHKIGGAGRIRELRIDEFWGPWPTLLAAPLAKEEIRFSHAIDVLRLAPNLMDCNICVWEKSEPSEGSNPVFVTSNLRALTLHEATYHDDGSPEMAFLRRLTLPSLIHLALTFDHPMWLVPSSSECLQSVPTLVTLRLRLERPSKVDVIFNGLECRPVILPKMTTLHVIYDYYAEFRNNYDAVFPNTPMFIDMLCARAQPTEPGVPGAVGLKSFRFEYSGYGIDFIDPRLLRLVAEGMEIFFGVVKPTSGW
ncbi:hypothetical protein DFH07DRAFT_767802 [Mycena maculata]|uniref:F-box domain-containing protein n=1 Tax=Mycena maculata TaxID=230809 RepID=A0AAD7JY55_9AGAR|nr:hypothetical protein DFH07DRAFT_767802 [Mycena maculata]